MATKELDDPTVRAAVEILLAGSFWFVLNMNDTFSYATAECAPFDVSDLELAAPVIAEHGHHALTAYALMAKGYKGDPIGNSNCDAYRAALERFRAIKAEHPDFCSEFPDAIL